MTTGLVEEHIDRYFAAVINDWPERERNLALASQKRSLDRHHAKTTESLQPNCGSALIERPCTDDDIARGGNVEDAKMGCPSKSKPKAVDTATIGPVLDKKMGSDYWLTEAGQKEIMRMSDKQWRPPVGYVPKPATGKAYFSGLSPFIYAASPLMPVSPTHEEWTEIELTADSGACDNVMPKSLCEHINIIPSVHSRAGVEYEVANGETIPNLGQRDCLLWTENAGSPKQLTMQVADVHKALLSLSRCADMGFESRLGRQAGCLIDTSTGEIIPLVRKGNLYVLRTWVRSNPFAGRGSPT